MTHTHDQLQKMDGAGLNRLVAGELGWKPGAFDEMSNVTHGGGKMFPDEEFAAMVMPDWAEDIRAAWALVEEHLPDASIDLTVRTRVSPSIRQRDYYCELFNGGAVIGYQSTLSRARADTAPRAIVLAFLLARGGGR